MNVDGAEPNGPPVAPTSHRRPGKAEIALPRDPDQNPPSFAEEIRENHRLAFLSILMPLGPAVGGLGMAFRGGESWGRQLGGGAIAVLGLLVVASYGLRFTKVLTAGHWDRTPARRTVRWILRYSWHAYLLGFGGYGAYLLVDWLGDR